MKTRDQVQPDGGEQIIGITDPELAGIEIAESFRRFAEGRSDSFSQRYFMLEEPCHQRTEKSFLHILGMLDGEVARTPEMSTVGSIGNVALLASSHFYDDGTPYGTLYQAAVIEPNLL